MHCFHQILVQFVLVLLLFQIGSRMASATQRWRDSSTARKSPHSRGARKKDARRRRRRLPLARRSHLRLPLHGHSSRRNQQCCRRRRLPPTTRMTCAGPRNQARPATSPLNLQGETLHCQRQAPQDLRSTESADPSGLRMRPHKQTIARGMLLNTILPWWGCPRIRRLMLRFRNVIRGARCCHRRYLRSFRNRRPCVPLMLRPVAELRPWSP